MDHYEEFFARSQAAHDVARWREARERSYANETIAQAAVTIILRPRPEREGVSIPEYSAMSLEALRYVAAHERGEVSSLTDEDATRVVAVVSGWMRCGVTPFAGFAYVGVTDAEKADEAAAMALDAATISDIAIRVGFTRRREDGTWSASAASLSYDAVEFDPGVLNRLSPSDADFVAAAAERLGLVFTIPAILEPEVPVIEASNDNILPPIVTLETTRFRHMTAFVSHAIAAAVVPLLVMVPAK